MSNSKKKNNNIAITLAIITLVGTIITAILNSSVITAWLQGNSQANTENSIVVDADKEWQDSGIQVSQGDKVYIKYIEGTWKVGPSNSYKDSGGYAVEVFSGIVKDAKYAALLGKIGASGVPFEAGKEISFIAKESGNLFFQMNDGGLYDNSGSVQIQVDVTK